MAFLNMIQALFPLPSAEVRHKLGFSAISSRHGRTGNANGAQFDSTEVSSAQRVSGAPYTFRTTTRRTFMNASNLIVPSYCYPTGEPVPKALATHEL